MIARLGVLLLALGCCISQSAQAQRPASGGTELELTGVVEGSYPNAEPTAGEALVRIGLTGVSLRGTTGAARLPSPGEVVFIRVNTRLRAQMIPPTGAKVRAVVRDGGRGLWVGPGAGWFEVETPPPSDDKDADADQEGPLVDVRGMSCRARIVKGRIGFEVVRVQAEGAAHDAGFQPGDVIVAAQGQTLASVGALAELAQSEAPLELSVIDVNTGKLATVRLGAASSPGPTSPPGGETTPIDDAAARITQALGIKVEATRVGLRGAVKVVSATAGQGGADAGLEPGDVIVAVNDKRVGSVEEFSAALPLRGGALTLLVRDVRSGKDVPIEAVAAALRGGEAALPTDIPGEQPAESPPLATGAADRFGLQTELTFYDAEAAVRIVAVKPGSAASRAGLRSGWIIVRANDAPMMHPDDLTKAEAAAGGRLTLRVVDPATKRDSTVTLTL